jgi:hypothetical protein
MRIPNPITIDSSPAGNALADRAINGEADAGAIARKNEPRVIATIKKWLKKRGLSSPGGRPRVILAKDLY